MALVSRQLNPNRLLSLDAFRGLTLAGMILVNNPGNPVRYAALEHAEWNGWTPTDLVYPFFVFIIGVALPYSLANRRARTTWPGLSLFDWVATVLLIIKWPIRLAALTGNFSHAPDPGLGGYDLFFLVLILLLLILPRLERRAIARGGSRVIEVIHHGFLLFALGFVWELNAANLTSYRLFGVLQRLGMIYLVVGLLVLLTRRRTQLLWAVGLLAAYWIVMKTVPVPGFGAGVLTLEGNLAGHIDYWLLNHAGMYNEGPPPYWNPEGFLVTVPAIVTGLIGALTGGWLREERSLQQKASVMVGVGVALVAVGLLLDGWFPINKNLWSPSFVCFTGGLALIGLAASLWLIDGRGWRRGVLPLIALGSNSILLYLLSGMVRHYMGEISVGSLNGEDLSLWQGAFHYGFATWLSPNNAALALSSLFVAFWAVVAMLLYRRRIFVKL